MIKSNPTATGSTASGQAEHSAVKTKEYYVRVSKSKKKFHALKFHTSAVDLSSTNKPEMSRDTSNLPSSRADWETMPKSGQGSEFNRENKELARRKKFGFMPKKVHADDLPWIITSKGNEKEKTKDKQFIGKKSISENSSYFVFIKCADGGFEAHPLEDWYSFAPHKTYKTLNIDEAEEEFKRRHKTLNKYLIMANKRKAQEGDGEEEEEEAVKSGAGRGKGKEVWDEENGKMKKKKASNLSDDDEEEAKPKKGAKKAPKRRNDDDEDEAKDKEDSDDGDDEGKEKDYSDSETDEEPEPDTAKYDEKYEEKGIDEEEAIKAMEKSSDEEGSDEDEDLTEEGKEYKKLMTKKEGGDEQEEDEFDEFFKTEDSKDSVSSFDEMDLDEGSQDKTKKAKGADGSNKLKRKASDNLLGKAGKKQLKTQPGAVQTHDESSSSSSTSTANQASKASKTAAIIAAAAAATAAKSGNTSTSTLTAAVSVRVEQSALTEEEVKRYLSRKPMTTKELLHKFRSKTQDKMTKQDLFQNLKQILDKLNCKIIEQNGVKYLSLP